MFLKAGLFAFLFSLSALATNKVGADGVVDIWPKIPFTRGADLCKYKDTYTGTRSEYMQKMVDLASNIMALGGSGQDALVLLKEFNQIYDRNTDLAAQQKYLDVTLESTLKSYISGYYREIRPRQQKLSFTNTDNSHLDYVAYGTYALAPDCQGDIQVTVHLIGPNGEQKSYLGHSTPAVVMSQIASQMFTEFQRTQFPSTIKVGKKNLTLVGGMNGSVDMVNDPKLAKMACDTLDARLPEADELEMLNAYGDWNGGVSLNERVWALPSGKVFAPMLRNPSPIRDVSEVNDREFLYYCVRD